MIGGSIYIDPDGVSSVSSRMLQTADEIDALRRDIVPQVYNVVEMSYPSLNVIPQVSPHVGAANDNIGYFASEAETVANELRTSAHVLNQVADAGRLMMEQLMQQSTLFTAPGQGSGSGSKSFWQQLLQDIQTPAGFLGNIIGLLGGMADYFKDVKNMKGLVKWLDSSGGTATLFGVGFVLDYLSDSNKSPNAFASKLIGNGIGTAVGLTPWGRVAELAAAGIQLGGGILSWQQYQIANEYSGTTRTELQDPAKGMQTASNNANIGKFFDDIGSLVVDSGGIGTPLAPSLLMANGIASMFGVTVSQPDNLPQDFTNTLKDGGNLLLSPVQFVTNYFAMQVDDGAASINQIAQNLPLPGAVKGVISSGTGDLIGATNDVANFVTSGLPDFLGLG